MLQRDDLNRSRIGTVACVPITSNLRWADALGNVHLLACVTGLPRHSAANVRQIVALGRELLVDRIGKSPRATLDLALARIETILGRLSRSNGFLRSS